MSLPSRTIILEEHVALPSLGDGVDIEIYRAQWQLFPEARKKLSNCSAGRIAEMDSAQISFQVMSHLPGVGVSNVAGCRGANEEMAEAAKKNPHRLGGFAVLPMSYPEEAAKELERAVRELGLVGALIDNHLEDMTHYDDERFWPFWAMAEKLDVPIYLHPSPPPRELIEKKYTGNYPQRLAAGLSTALWGWHEDVGLHFLKLCAAGVFDRFPKLKIIIGHMGEMVPFMLDRAERMPFFKFEGGQKTLQQIWDQNIWVTTSGMFSLNPLATLLKTTRKDHILFSIDYPFEDIKLGPKFLKEVAQSGMVSEEELDMIAYKNAESLLKLDNVAVSR